jgi:UDP-2-acetamido-3-amino-2,3-dideoxy-glucuronate N-acetyltransferase
METVHAIIRMVRKLVAGKSTKFGTLISLQMDKEYYVHESSYIDAGALIGKGTKIWHFSHISGTAKIGEHCNFGQNVFIDNGVSIGNGVKIQNNVSVYKGVVVEDGVFLGPSMVFTNVINPRSFVERKTEFKPTFVRKGATIGANATIVCGIEIGAYSLIGAGAVVIKNIPAYALIVGNPARQVGWMSETGIKLVFDGEGKSFCEEEGRVYQLENGVVNIAG